MAQTTPSAALMRDWLDPSRRRCPQQAALIHSCVAPRPSPIANAAAIERPQYSGDVGRCSCLVQSIPSTRRSRRVLRHRCRRWPRRRVRVLVAARSASSSPIKGLFSRRSQQGCRHRSRAISADTLPSGYCPPCRSGPAPSRSTIYERNHEDDPNFVRFQASITETARECHTTGTDTLTIKVGIAGRLIAGPKGGAGKFTLPLRVAVIKQHGGNVFYSAGLQGRVDDCRPPNSPLTSPRWSTISRSRSAPATAT